MESKQSINLSLSYWTKSKNHLEHTSNSHLMYYINFIYTYITFINSHQSHNGNYETVNPLVERQSPEYYQTYSNYLEK